MFCKCTNLETVEMSGVTAIGNHAFNNCESLQTISGLDTVKTVGVNAFARCIALKSIQLDAVETVESSAFSGCTSVKTISLGSAGHALSIANINAFTNCKALENLILYNTTIPKATTGTKTQMGVNSTNGLTVTMYGGIQAAGCDRHFA